MDTVVIYALFWVILGLLTTTVIYAVYQTYKLRNESTLEKYRYFREWNKDQIEKYAGVQKDIIYDRMVLLDQLLEPIIALLEDEEDGIKDTPKGFRYRQRGT